MLRQLFFSLFLCLHAIRCFAVDFDVIVLGSSPICLLEALYQHGCGKSVLILEASRVCGGAWKSGKICGIPHADITCHEIGTNLQVLRFLENFVGCTAVSMEPPNIPFSTKEGGKTKGYYFTYGCYELVSKLLRLIEENNITLLLEQPLESIFIENNIVLARTKGIQFSTEKLIIPRHCSFLIENQQTELVIKKQAYHHIYLLIEDHTLPRFSYKYGRGTDIVRAMNLSPFVGLVGTGKHLMIAQTNVEVTLKEGQKYLEFLKQLDLVDNSARLLKVEIGTYEQYRYDNAITKQAKATPGLIQLLETSSLEGMSQYISKWEKVLTLPVPSR